MYLRGLQPTIWITLKARRLWRLQYSTANATIMPPMNMTSVSLKYKRQVLSESYK